MRRGCVIASAIWVALFAIYFASPRDVPLAGRILAGAGMATLVGLGLMMLNAARRAWVEVEARRRFARGEHPRDGERVGVVGQILPVLDPLHAPLSGRECVFYRYDIGPDYMGAAFARCAVRTAYGSYRIGSFTVISGFPKDRGDAARAQEYVRATAFEELTTHDDAGSMLFSSTPPVRKDWRIGAPPASLQEGSETIVPVGATVGVFGRFEAASSAIVAEEHGYVWMRTGDAVNQLPRAALSQFFSGLALIVVAHVMLWAALQHASL